MPWQTFLKKFPRHFFDLSPAAGSPHGGMDAPARRRALQAGTRALGLFVLAGVLPEAQAQEQLDAWAQAFDSRDFNVALRALGAEGAAPDPRVRLDGPDVAENGALVPFTVSSPLPGVSQLALLVEHNPVPLTAVFALAPGTEPFVATRLKMAESSTVHALVRAQDGLFLARRQVRVIQGGCVG